jgi:hypothetical protein
MKLSPSQWRKLGVSPKLFTGAGAHARQAAWLRNYRPDMVNVLLPPLRKKCKNLRQVSFEKAEPEPFDDPSWIVYLDSSLEDDEDGSGALSGSIDYIHSETYSLSTSPPSDIPPPTAPSGFQINNRFDPTLTAGGEGQIPLYGQWLLALREAPCFAKLHASIALGDLPLTFDDLIVIYERQASSRRGQRLEEVDAPGITPCLAGFRSFARVASSSLTKLVLADSYDEHRTSLSIGEINLLVPLIRYEFPHLDHLALALHGVDRAEAICQDLLYNGMLGDIGTLTHLDIYVAPTKTHCFNVVRYLGILVDTESTIRTHGAARAWEADACDVFLRMLRGCVYIPFASVPYKTLTEQSNQIGAITSISRQFPFHRCHRAYSSRYHHTRHGWTPKEHMAGQGGRMGEDC